jgi:hypothetical protein
MAKLLEPGINGVALGEQDTDGLLCEPIYLFQSGHAISLGRVAGKRVNLY